MGKKDVDSRTLIDKLKCARMSSMAAILERQRLDADMSSKGFEDRLEMMVDEEIAAQNTRRMNRLIRRANFALPSAHVEGIREIPERKLDKGQVVNLAKCDFIRQGHHVVLQGPAGSGKTYIACAIGVSACQQGFKTRYLRMSEFLDDLTYAQEQKCLMEYVKTLNKFDLLIMDEWLTRPVDENEVFPLLDFLEYRCGQEDKKPIIFCTHFPRDEWYPRLVRSDACTASGESTLDRVVHNCYCITVSSLESVRKLESEVI